MQPLTKFGGDTELGPYYLTLLIEFPELLKTIPKRNFMTLANLFIMWPKKST